MCTVHRTVATPAAQVASPFRLSMSLGRNRRRLGSHRAPLASSSPNLNLSAEYSDPLTVQGARIFDPTRSSMCWAGTRTQGLWRALGSRLQLRPLPFLPATPPLVVLYLARLCRNLSPSSDPGPTSKASQTSAATLLVPSARRGVVLCRHTLEFLNDAVSVRAAAVRGPTAPEPETMFYRSTHPRA